MEGYSRNVMDVGKFRKLLQQGEVKKGRLVLPENTPIENQKVKGATPVYDGSGKKVADSKLENRVRNIFLTQGLKFKQGIKYDIIPTIRRECIGRTLRKRTWMPDFVFEDVKTVVDAKGHITEIAKIKIQLFLHLYPDWNVYIVSNNTEALNIAQKIKSLKASL